MKLFVQLLVKIFLYISEKFSIVLAAAVVYQFKIILRCLVEAKTIFQSHS